MFIGTLLLCAGVALILLLVGSFSQSKQRGVSLIKNLIIFFAVVGGFVTFLLYL